MKLAMRSHACLLYDCLPPAPRKFGEGQGTRKSGLAPFLARVLKGNLKTVIRVLESLARFGVACPPIAVYLADTSGGTFLLVRVNCDRLMTSRVPPGRGNRPQRKT